MVLIHFPFASPAKKAQGSGRSNNLEPCGDEASLKYPTLGVKELDTAFKILRQTYGGKGRRILPYSFITKPVLSCMTYIY